MTPRAAQIRNVRAVEELKAKLDRILELLEPASAGPPADVERPEPKLPQIEDALARASKKAR
jgi:hypothetical protein